MSTSQEDHILNPRKRSADHLTQLTDPDEFLESYFKKRGICGDLSSDFTRSIDKMAECAREEFKKSRTLPETEHALFDTKNEMLTPEQKYKRRLVNNRKSSAASRVHREVLKAERAWALSEQVKKARAGEEKVAQLQLQLRRAEEKVAQLEAENGNLRLQGQHHTMPGTRPPPFRAGRNLPSVNNYSRRSASPGLSPLNTNLGSASVAPPTTPPAYNMVPLTPKTAERVITTALKLEDSVVKGVMSLDKQTSSTLEQSTGIDTAPFSHGFEASRCGDASPNSRQEKALFGF